MDQAGPSSDLARRSPARKRQKRTVCTQCRRNGVLCDGIPPCTSCIARGIAQMCCVRPDRRKDDECASPAEMKAAHMKMLELLSSRDDSLATPVPSEKDKLHQYIGQLVEDALMSRKGKEIFLSFRDKQAAVIMDWLQKFTSEPRPLQRIWDSVDDYRNSLRRLLVNLSKSAGVLPSYLFLVGISCSNRDLVAGGGFADIYKGSYEGELVALKRLRVFKSDEDREKSKKAFCAEALVWQQLQHQHILPFLGVDVTTFSPFQCMVSPWMENGNVMQCINSLHEKQVNIPFNRWIRQIAEGLAYLHSQRIVHGDLRGANILINSYMTVQLCDFGLAMFADSTTASWGSVACGAVRWLAPEVLKGSRSTYKSDTYAFGCVCLEIYTRKHPFFDIASDAQVVARVLQGARPEKPENSGRFQQGFWNLVKMCWNEDPSDRPDAAFLAKTLEIRDDGLFLTEYDLVFAPHLRYPASSLSARASPRNDDESDYLDAHSFFESASHKSASVLKAAFGSPLSDIDFSPSGSSFGVVSLPTSSVNPSPDNSVPIKSALAQKASARSPLVRLSPTSSSPFSLISSHEGSLPVLISAPRHASVDSYEGDFIL